MAEAKWRQLAEELSSTFDLQVIDPGESTVTARLTDADGNIDPECTQALSRWYGSSRSAGLSQDPDDYGLSGNRMIPAHALCASRSWRKPKAGNPMGSTPKTRKRRPVRSTRRFRRKAGR